MKRFRSPELKIWLWMALAVAAITLLAGFPLSRTNASSRRSKSAKALIGNYDIRVNGGRDLSELLQTRPAAKENIKSAANALIQAQRARRDTSRKTDVKVSRLTGAAEVVTNKTAEFVTQRLGRRPGAEIVREFLRENAESYGLKPSDIENLRFIGGESVSPGSGMRMIRFEQVINGISIFQSETRAIIAPDGTLNRTVGLLIPWASDAEPLDNLISPSEALASALSTVRLSLDSAKMTFSKVDQSGTKALVSPNLNAIQGDVQSKLVYFPAAPGILVPAWSQLTFTNKDHDWYTLVDARTGMLLWRKNIRADASTQQARFSVYVQSDGSTPSDSPAPHSPTAVTPGSGTQFPEISRTTVSMLTVQDATASPDGWIPDGGSTTTGNNVDAYLDRVQGGNANQPDTGALDNNGRPVGNPDVNTNNRDFLGSSPRDFTFSPPPVAGNPDAGDSPLNNPYQRGAVTQLFYITNWYHDQLYNLGFDEAAGNFQQDNFGRGGTANDRVLAEAQDGSGNNNANFSTPPDGASGRMQMFLFTFPNPDRDGDLDAEVVMHELTHGVSNRLIGNADGLNWSPGQGMGEGWSDFYSLSLLNNTNADDPDAEYAEGGYATYKLGGLTDNYLYGIRRFPYSTDNSINPLTWADVDSVTNDVSGGIPQSPLGLNSNGALEVHNVGEVWCLSLWEMRSRIINDPAGANADVPTGNHTSLQLVTDALKMTPSNPSFTEARDALIDADGVTNSFANEKSIWGAFADRGLGYKAIAPLGIVGFNNFGDLSVGESFSTPYLDPVAIAVDDSVGNNNGSIDPGETISLTVGLFNPWHNTAQGVPSATATLTSLTSGVTVTAGNATYGGIAAQATVNGTPFTVQIPLSATCGQSLNFDLQTNSSLGTVTVPIRLRVGTPSGVGAPITYTRTIAGGLAIPDNNFIGVTDTQTITDDFQIADVNFRVDNLQHTFTGDLTVLLRAPNGYGVDLIWLREVLFGGGDGDNFINTVIDDQAVNDLNQSQSTDAPFTGSWLPAFNSPVWNLFGDPGILPDPVGQLSRLNGESTEGNWSVHVADNFAIDTGTLNSWSLIITPVAFSCSPFVCVPPSITQQPTTQSICGATGSVTFTAAATGNPTPTAQWQVSTDGGATFTDIPGATSSSLTVSAALAQSGRLYRVVFSNPCGGSVASNVVSLGVFDYVLRDDSSGSTLKFNSKTGDFVFCCGSTVVSGKGSVIKKGTTASLSFVSGAIRVQASADLSTKRGSATLKSGATVLCSIVDRNITDNPCTQCGP
jgi:subtilisin-like proprotein convertase family protein